MVYQVESWLVFNPARGYTLFPNSAEGWSSSVKKISLYIDEQLWHHFRIECVKRKTSASQDVAGLMEQQLHQWQLEGEKRAAPSEGCCSNPFAVHRKEPMLDGPLDERRPARSPHTADPRPR